MERDMPKTAVCMLTALNGDIAIFEPFLERKSEHQSEHFLYNLLILKAF